MVLKIQMVSNLDAVSEMAGAIEGIGEGLEKDSYINAILEQAHEKASHDFDLVAASAGAAGHFTHMFEFGTVGVTRGVPKFMDPTAQEARLWKHTFTGIGKERMIGFEFRPALNRNPQPTTAYTGVKSKYLRKLSRRKYVFWNKAMVTEMGMDVEIRTKNVSHLFVPFGQEGARNPMYREKNFVFWNTDQKGPIVNRPGETTRGTFTAFWINWWGGAGDAIINKEAEKSINIDVERAVTEAARRANATAMKPAQMNNPTQAAANGRRAAKNTFGKNRRKK